MSNSGICLQIKLPANRVFIIVNISLTVYNIGESEVPVLDCEHNYYSVIIKSCSRRESLVRRLETILLRGRLAIKMALDNMPSIIIYKGKTDNIVPILKAFRDEYAAITILAEGVPPALPLYKSYRDFGKLSLELQLMLTNVPQKLWLGETIQLVVPASFADENGALVISSHALYFIDKPSGDENSRWLIIPYSQINNIPTPTAYPEANLVINYQDTTGYQNSIFTIPTQLFKSTLAAIEQAKASKQYLLKLKTSCTTCGRVSEDYTDNVPYEEYCNCGGQYQRMIIA